MSVRRSILAASLLGLLALPAYAERSLTVPLVVDVPHLDEVVGQALGLDETGRGRLVLDDCNRIDLSDLQLAVVDRRLELSLATTTHTGAFVIGRCTGPRPVAGRLLLEMKPGVDGAGRAVLFSPEGAEIRRPDGTAGLLSGPSRLLADQLIVPRLAQVRIDVSALLEAVDSLIEEFLPRDPFQPVLAERGRLAAVSAESAGLRADLQFALNALPSIERVAEPALADDEVAAWQRIEDELDGFLTVLIMRLAAQLASRDLQLDFLALLLDMRQRIAEALVVDDPVDDPVRVLFVQAWDGLRPLLSQLDPLGLADDRDLRLAGFIAAGDALLAVDALGAGYGLEISRDGLRRLARILLDEDAPASFTPLPLTEDPVLRELFGFIASADQARMARSLRWWQRLLPMAWADTVSIAESLRGVVPRLAFLEDYLRLVSQLLDVMLDLRMDAGSRVPIEHRPMFQPLVQATAWRETCWRHYVGSVDEPQVIRSAVGAIGMMQIMGRVWRGVYDVERLEAEVEYNVNAGIEILEHYLVDYAIRRREHEQPGGADNLVRATYAAYNGGPSHLTRYRRDDTAPTLRAIDDAFWRDFQHIREHGWPEVGRCFSVPN